MRQPKEKETMWAELETLLSIMSKTKLAYLLGMQDTQSITQWVFRGKVPLKYQERIREILNAESN